MEKSEGGTLSGLEHSLACGGCGLQISARLLTSMTLVIMTYDTLLVLILFVTTYDIPDKFNSKARFTQVKFFNGYPSNYIFEISF